MSVVWLNVCRVLPECPLFRNLSVARGRCSKIICQELHFVNSSQSANLLCQTSKRYKYYIAKINEKHILLYLPRAIGKFLKKKKKAKVNEVKVYPLDRYQSS